MCFIITIIVKTWTFDRGGIITRTFRCRDEDLVYAVMIEKDHKNLMKQNGYDLDDDDFACEILFKKSIVL